MQCNMLCDIDRQSSFSHGRTSGKNKQITSLHTGGHSIEVKKTSRNASDIVRIFRHLLNAVQELNNQFVHALKTLPHPRTLFANAENLLLSFIQNIGNRAAVGIQCRCCNFIADTDQFPQYRSLPNDLCVASNIRRTRHILGQRI